MAVILAGVGTRVLSSLAMSRWAQLVVEELVGGIAQVLGEPPPPVPDFAVPNEFLSTDHASEDWG